MKATPLREPLESSPVSQPPQPDPPPAALTPAEVVRLAFLVARRRVDAHSARDIGQETWLKASRQAAWAEWTPARARAWVRTVAANAALDLLRKRAPGPLEVDPAAGGDPAELAERAEWSAREAARARALLATLSREDRELLAWRVLEGKTYAELARLRGLAESSLRARFARLRARLQQQEDA